MESDKQDEVSTRNSSGIIIIAAGIAVVLIATVIVLAVIAERDPSPPPDPATVHSNLQQERLEAAESSVEEALKDAATAQETYLVENDSYTDQLSDLEEAGLVVPPEVAINALRYKGGLKYCIEATHVDLAGRYFFYRSEIGQVMEGSQENNCGGP